jgi:hypothetical protein
MQIGTPGQLDGLSKLFCMVDLYLLFQELHSF